MDRYEQIHDVEDLGLAYPPADDTDDLVGVTEKKNLAPGATGDEVDVHPLPNKE